MPGGAPRGGPAASGWCPLTTGCQRGDARWMCGGPGAGGGRLLRQSRPGPAVTRPAGRLRYSPVAWVGAFTRATAPTTSGWWGAGGSAPAVVAGVPVTRQPNQRRRLPRVEGRVRCCGAGAEWLSWRLGVPGATAGGGSRAQPQRGGDGGTAPVLKCEDSDKKQCRMAEEQNDDEPQERGWTTETRRWSITSTASGALGCGAGGDVDLGRAAHSNHCSRLGGGFD